MAKPPRDASLPQITPPPRRQVAKPFKFEYLVNDISRIRRTLIDQAMRPLGITRSQWSILTTLSRGGNDGMMQVDLARLLEIGKVTVGGLVDRLEATGHVVRRPDPADRRIKRVFITPQGFGMLEEMIAVAGGLNERIMENVPRAERILCEEVLFAVKQNLREVLQEMNAKSPASVPAEPEDQEILSGKPE